MVLAASTQLGCWSSGSADDPQVDGSGGADESSGAGTEGAEASPTQGSSDPSGADETGDASCYGASEVGCTSLSWSDIVTIIETLYLFQDSYYGYSESEAKELARQLYDNGTVPGAWLRVVTLQELGDGRWRAHVAVADADGRAAEDLDPAAFTIAFDGGDAVAPASAYALGDADPDEVHAELSVVIDDSGSIADCDAAFVMSGVSHLFSTIPPLYASSLVKFADDVYLAHERTEDIDALAHAMQTFCTDRGSTSLWDGIERGLDDLPQFDGLRALIVFTDGLDNDSSTSLSAVIDHAQAEHVPVFVVGLGLADMFALSKLAIDTGGGLVYIHSGQQALSGFELVTGFVSDSYVVEFEAEPGFGSVQIAAEVAEGQIVADAASPAG